MVFALVWWTGVLLACSGTEPGPAAPVVVTVDTLRADHLDLLNLPIDGCRRYTRAHASSPWTSSSSYSLLTGLQPHGQYKGPPKARPGPIPDGQAWPDTVLSDQPVVHVLAGQPEGSTLDKVVGSPELFAEAHEWVVDERNRGRSLYLHGYGPHAPWDGFKRRGEHLRSSPAMAEIIQAGMGLGEVSAEVAAWGRVQYPQAVRDTVWNLLPAFSQALAHGRLVVLTSDHGEALGEDGYWNHATALHDPQVHVPLVVCGSGVVAGIDDTPVGPLCVAETVTGRGPCDLRTGQGLRAGEAGMLVDDEWITRDVGAEWAERPPTTAGG